MNTPRDTQSSTRLRGLYNIRTALLAFVLTPFVLVLIISGGYSLHKLEQAARAGLEEDIELIARAIRQPLSYALENRDTGALRRAITSASDIGRVYGVYVYDEDGHRIVARGPTEAQVKGIKAADLAARGSEQSEFEQAGGEEVFSYFVPLIDTSGQIHGLLQITRRGSDFVQLVRDFRTRALAVLGLSALLVLVLVWVGYQRAIGRHIQAMGRRMSLIGRGHRDQRLTPEGPEEIRFLARGTNRMLDDILASERELDDRRARELELKSQLHQTEKLAAIGRFAAGVAHELGTPLSVADGKAQRALRKEQPDIESVRAIREQLHRVERTVRQLMDFARPVPAERRPVAPADLVRSSLEQVFDEAERRGVQIERSGPEDTPSIDADRLRLEQALINLLRNAIQAAERVAIRWRAAGGTVTIEVDDDGPGIAPERRTSVLEPFVTDKAAGMGTGLGLAVVNAVASEHGGQLTIDESDWGGARFTLTLPAGTERETEHD